MIPFINLPAQYRSIEADVDAAVKRVLQSGRYTLGEEVTLFEQEFAAFCGVRHAVAVNTGTSALHLALLAAGVGPGDEVITTPFTFVATVAAVLYIGARPVFVDIDPRSFTIDVDRIEAALTWHTKAIIPVHLYGQPAEMHAITDIARQSRVTVIEDAAQAHGALYHGSPVGSLGDLGCFSFYPGKNLGACGEGGCVTTDDPALARTLRMLRDWGCERRYCHELRGYNYRMDAIQAAILRVKLRRLPEWNECRRVRAALYRRLLADANVILPTALSDRHHVYHLFAIRTEHRESLRTHLAKRGIETGIHYPLPVHLQPAYSDLGYGPGDFPESERVATEELSLPLYPELAPSDNGALVRSIHGVTYSRLWNSDLLTMLKDTATDFQPPQKGFNGATGLYCGEQDLFTFLLDPAGWIDIGGQEFAPGFFCWNSEVGRRSLGIQAFWFQRCCQNHIVWDAVCVEEFSKKHTGNIDDSLQEMRRIVEGLVAKRDARKDGFAAIMKKAMATTVGATSEDASKELLKHGMTRDLVKRAVEKVGEEGKPFTLWTLLDALTQLTGAIQFAVGPQFSMTFARIVFTTPFALTSHATVTV